MIENTTILQVVGGLIAIGTAGTIAYIYKEEILSFFNRKSKTYLVQATQDSSFKLDNYTCSLGNEIDSRCEVLKVNYNEKNYIVVKDIDKWQEKTNNKLEKNFLYKLTIDRSKIKQEFVDQKTIIKIKNSETNDVAELKIISLISDKKASELANLWGDYKVLVQAQKSVSSAAVVTLNKCAIGSEKAELSCKIYEFNDPYPHKHTLDFSKIKKIEDLSKIQAGRYYVVDFSSATTNKNLLNEDKKLTSISAKDASSEKAQFSLISKIIANIDSSTPTQPTKNQAIIFNNNFVEDQAHSTYIIAKSDSTAGSDGFNPDRTTYKCVIGNNGGEKEDTNCSLIELKDDERTLEKITNSEASTVADSLKSTTVKWFKIIVNNSIIDSINTWDGTKKIKIKSTASGSTTEYKKFDPLFLIENGKFSKGNPTLSIATFISQGNNDSNINEITTGQTYKCKVGSSNNAESCEIYKLNSTFNPEKISSSIFENLIKSEDKTHWVANSSFLVELKGSTKFNSNNLQEKNNVIIVNGSNNNKEIAHLKINAFVADVKAFTNNDALKLLVIT